MGLLLGLYYGGTGLGIALSAVLVPTMLKAAGGVPHGWAWAWWALSAACLAATGALAWVGRRLLVLFALVANENKAAPHRAFSWRDFSPALAGYTLFGMGYIGYMTFVVALIKEQGATPGFITLFYALLGMAVMVSPLIWARLLDRSKGGQALALLNGLLGCGAVLPAITNAWPLVLLSGVLFGGVFLSVVASTTALVRHNLPHSLWATGISAFTTVFAAGQIVGPAAVGLIADAVGAGSDLAGLQRGLIFSAVALWLGALVAVQQRPLR